jgi:hypothetical protein
MCGFLSPVRHRACITSRQLLAAGLAFASRLRHTEDERMSRRGSGRSLIGLVLEIGLIALVVTLLPKVNLRPQPAAANSPPVAVVPPDPAPPADPSWWQVEPAARATSWHETEPQPIHVEQTLENASRRLLSGAADIAGRAATDLIPPATNPPGVAGVER